jgi:hypothetical protein
MATTGARVVELRAAEVRGALVDGAELRAAIVFQNDVNALIASLAQLGTEQEGHGLVAVQAPFGCLPPLRERRRAGVAIASERAGRLTAAP